MPVSTMSPNLSVQQPAMIALTVSFRGTSHTITLPLSSPAHTLHTQLEDLTGVPPVLQKLLYQGKKLVWKSEEDAQSTTLEKAGLRDGMKVQLLGSMLNGLEGPKEESEDLRRERIMRERALKAPVKLRSTGSGIMTLSSPSIQYRFNDIRALPRLPNPSGVVSFLKKLASDPAIIHIMQKHRFSVGVLTELASHEHPELEGLNLDHGTEISLRLRTNAYDGFRSYSTVRRILCHELAHNICDVHDENFQKMDSQLTREVAEYERSVAQGTHPLDGGGMYQSSSSELEAPKTYVGGSGAPVMGAESLEDKRRKILEAAMDRLRKEKEEIEHSCGTDKMKS